MDETDKRLKTALFRYGVIAPLICRRLDHNRAQTLRRDILLQLWEYPNGAKKPIAERTLRFWVARYRKLGFAGLFDSKYKVTSPCRSIPEDVLQQAETLRREIPSRSIKTIIRLLKSAGLDTSGLAERTLARQLLRIGATKSKEKATGSHQRWEQLHANDLWQGDTAHGIWLPDPTNAKKSKKTKLILFIDDATRVCVHAEFYFDEQLPSLVDCFGKALLKHGRPCRMLFDNAFIYHSTTMATMCAELGSEISFCRPRAPQGKGKVERFIHTVKSAFYPEAYRVGLSSLSELNQYFHAWLSQEYQQRSHSELNGMTPNARWNLDASRILLVTPEEIRRALMLRVKRKVHPSTATVSVDSRDYQASVGLAGQEVEVRWNPQHSDFVELWMSGEYVETAQEFRIKPWVEPRVKPTGEDELPDNTPFESSKNYLRGLLSGPAEQSATALKANELLALEEFFALVCQYLQRELTDGEQLSLRQFFARYSPLRRDLVATSIDRAVSVKGHELHIRYYLEQLEQSLRRR
jgi:putative transposase